MADVTRYLKALMPQVGPLGRQGVDALAKELAKQADQADKSWQRSILGLLADSVGKYGPDGIQAAQEALESLMEGKKGKKLSEVTDDLEVASDLLAALQNAEAARKSAARKFLLAVGQTLALISKGFLKGLV